MATAAMQQELPDLWARWEAKPTRHMIVVCARELRRLAARRKDYGVTAFDTKQIAMRYGFVTGQEAAQRALSWFAAVPKVARLHRTERVRLSPQRNAQRVYVHG